MPSHDSNPSAQVPDVVPDNLGRFLSSMNAPLVFDSHRLPDFQEGADWLSDGWKQHIVWELTELSFRMCFIELDVLLRQCYPAHAPLHEHDANSRFDMIAGCWGVSGNDSVGTLITPGPCDNALCSSNSTARLSALAKFGSIMLAWPRADEELRPFLEYNDDAQAFLALPIESQTVCTIEACLWRFYRQTYYDFRHLEPPLPFLRPDPPFS